MNFLKKSPIICKSLPVLGFIFLLLVTAVDAASLPVNFVKLPEGFKIHVFADNIPNARSLEVSPSGVVYVGNRSKDKVYALKDLDGDYRADKVYILAKGLWSPNGVAFHNGDLYVAEINKILKFENIEKNLSNPPKPVVINDNLPGISHHGWKFIAFGPDGRLYVPVGAPCNVCEREDPRFSAILRMKPDGTAMEVFASGVRNTVGFDWHPETEALWFTDNGRDNMGDNRPPDELNRAPEKGMHFGFPYCHGGDIPDPEYGDKMSCDETTPPQQKLGPHVAALGMRFYTGEMFPPEYKNQIFIAEHGSWNRSAKIGYRIMLVKLDEAQNAVSYTPFATGWLLPGEKVWGRPVDVEILDDGSMLVSDDFAGAIYRIYYEP